MKKRKGICLMVAAVFCSYSICLYHGDKQNVHLQNPEWR